MQAWLDDSLRNAFAGMTSGPAPLLGAVRFYAKQLRERSDSIEELLHRGLSSPNDEVRKLFNDHLGQWDWEESGPWTSATEPNTPERRARIYQLLGIGRKLQKALDDYVVQYRGPTSVVISDPKRVPDWYTFEFRRKHDFYWKRLRQFLRNVRKLSSDSVNSVESTATRILDRLADPSSRDIFKARGLVVGYVQSGKTTNFTAVIAKAIDAGYRLIIVLSGTTNLLRNQTQRRLDMELIGRENIVRPGADLEHDYLEDDGWPDRFISYGNRPSLVGSVDISRLTTQEDFRAQDAGLNPLDFHFEKRERRRPLFDRENLNHAGARVAIIKKEAQRLSGFIKELKGLGKTECAEIPALIIDDESDQASVNTVNPKERNKDRTRSRINEKIVEILGRLPRAQYVGYTATPFANVFVDPSDPGDIYPSDFIISLERPTGYMGAYEFLDFRAPRAGRLSNKDAHIRDIPDAKDPNRDMLQEAMDAFVLTGALKKFRAKRGNLTYKHHTMLFHHSTKTDDHLKMVNELRAMWGRSAYGSPGASTRRLKALLENDFRNVWQDRGQAQGMPFPKTYSELRSDLGEALDEIRRGGTPVLMVNSADGNEVPDFESKTGVWKIIVGGAKLSRGYTIEGLTVSYFRRRTRMQDTLMQMGRWFGYRAGYQDLVRLYIGRAERHGQKTMDLYKAFETMCRDEEAFRAQLYMYEKKKGVTPKDVPALVFNSHPGLRPTSRNKMFRARLKWAAFDYREPTSQASGKDTRRNAALFSKLLGNVKVRTSLVVVSGTSSEFDVKWAAVSARQMLDVLKNIRWEKVRGKDGNPIHAEIEYLERKLAPIDGWIIVAPQVLGEAKPWKVGNEIFNCVARSKVAEEGSNRFGVFSSPNHLDFAKWLVGSDDVKFVSSLMPRKRTGVLLFYPTRELPLSKILRGGEPVMGFGLALPADGLGTNRTAYAVAN